MYVTIGGGIRGGGEGGGGGGEKVGVVRILVCCSADTSAWDVN